MGREKKKFLGCLIFGTRTIQAFSQKSRTPTVAKEFQIGLHDPALRPRRGRFGTLLQQLECGIFGRTAVVADLELFCNSWSEGFLGERLYAQRLRSSWWLQPLVQDHNGLDPDGASCGNSDLCVCFLNKRCSTLRGESPTARGPATAFLGRSRKMTWQQRAPPHSPASNEIEAAMRSDPYFLSSAVRAFDFTC